MSFVVDAVVPPYTVIGCYADKFQRDLSSFNFSTDYTIATQIICVKACTEKVFKSTSIN